MCKFFSFVADNEGEFYYSKIDSSHETIIKDNKLNDRILEKDKRKIVRLEYSTEDVFDFNSYKLVIDETETPKWFDTSYSKRASKFAAEKIKEFVFVDCKETVVLKNRLGYFKNSMAELSGDSKARLYENSKAWLYDNAEATLLDNSKADLSGNSIAWLHENSVAELYGDSTAVLYDNSRATLYGDSTARLYGNSTARPHDNSKASKISHTATIINER